MIEETNYNNFFRFARKLRELRVNRGLAQKELADCVGVSESAIRSYELGIRNPKSESFYRIAKVLDVKPEYLSTPEFKNHLEFYFTLLENAQSEGYTVTIIDGMPAIIPLDKPSGDSFKSFLFEWNTMKEQREAGDISDKKYKEWNCNSGYGLNSTI